MNSILTIASIVWLNMIRRKDVYVLLILMAVLLLALVSLDIFGLGGTTAYIKDVGLLFTWFFGWIITVISATRELPEEETRRTIFTILSKPIPRWSYLAGKWMGTWLGSTAAVLVFYCLVVTVTLSMNGSFMIPTLVQAFYLHALLLGIISSIGIALSTRLNQDAAATLSLVITAASFLIVPRVPEFVAKEAGLKAGFLMFIYNLLPHFELFDLRRRIVHDYGPAAWKAVSGITFYGISLILMFLFVSWLLYRNKMFNKDRMSA